MPGQRPEFANTKGARWNPPGVPTLYFSMERQVATAEGDYLSSVQPQPIAGVRQIHQLELDLQRVLDLTDRDQLRALGVTNNDLVSNDYTACRRVGGTAEWAGYQAIIVPSARSMGANLVVFPRKAPPDFEIRIVSSEPR